MKNSFSLLMKWFSQNKRDLPWRHSRDFYHIWVSEIMLQQTQVKTVVPYYKKFIRNFPSIHDLAKASLDQVLKNWEGFGYYSRARNLHKAAITLSKLKKYPDTFDELIKFPGFGPYTAAAVLSFTYNAPYAVVDGNVKRVISRFLFISDDISSVNTKNKIQNIVDTLLPDNQSALFNEAIMELGALICLPKLAKCDKCPLQVNCKGYLRKMVNELPFRKKRGKIPRKKRISFVFWSKDLVFIQKRPENEMLGALWKFYTIEKVKIPEIRHHLITLNIDPIYSKLKLVKQNYSHFRLELHVYLIQIESCTLEIEGKWVKRKDLEQYPFDRASIKIINQILD